MPESSDSLKRETGLKQTLLSPEWSRLWLFCRYCVLSWVIQYNNFCYFPTDYTLQDGKQSEQYMENSSISIAKISRYLFYLKNCI